MRTLGVIFIHTAGLVALIVFCGAKRKVESRAK
jgi:hypothetical protein